MEERTLSKAREISNIDSKRVDHAKLAFLCFYFEKNGMYEMLNEIISKEYAERTLMSKNFNQYRQILDERGFSPTTRQPEKGKFERVEELLGKRDSLTQEELLELARIGKMRDLFKAFETRFRDEFQKFDKYLSVVNNGVLIERMREFGDEITKNDLLKTEDGEEQKRRDNSFYALSAIVLEILKILKNSGKLEELSETENTRNETLNSILPENIRIVSDEETITDRIKGLLWGTSVEYLHESAKVDFITLARTIINKYAHEKEKYAISTLLGEHADKQGVLQKKQAPTLETIKANLKTSLEGLFISSITFETAKEGLKAEKEIKERGLRGNAARAFKAGKNPNIFAAYHKLKEKCVKILQDNKIPENVQNRSFEEIINDSMREPDQESFERAFIDQVEYEMSANEAQRIPIYMSEIGRIKNDYDKNNQIAEDFHVFLLRVLDAEELKDESLLTSLRGTPKEETYEAVKRLKENLEKDMFVAIDDSAEVLKEIFDIYSSSRAMFKLKQILTMQLANYALSQEGAQRSLIIEHNPKENEDDDDGVIIYLPHYISLFGGHYKTEDITQEDQQILSSLDPSPAEILESLKTKTEDYASYIPMRLNLQQTEYFLRLAKAIATLEKGDLNPEEIEHKWIEDSEFIKLVELREAATNDLEKEREYKKVVYQIMLGAGLDTYTRYFKEKDLDSISNYDIAHYDFQRYTAPETRTMTEDVTSSEIQALSIGEQNQEQEQEHEQ